MQKSTKCTFITIFSSKQNIYLLSVNFRKFCSKFHSSCKIFVQSVQVDYNYVVKVEKVDDCMWLASYMGDFYQIGHIDNYDDIL